MGAKNEAWAAPGGCVRMTAGFATFFTGPNAQDCTSTYASDSACICEDAPSYPPPSPPPAPPPPPLLSDCPAATSLYTWLLSDAAESCTDACAGDGLACVEGAAVPEDYNCMYELYQHMGVSCSQYNLNAGGAGQAWHPSRWPSYEYCYYRNPSATAPFSCSAQYSGQQRFCPCLASGQSVTYACTCLQAPPAPPVVPPPALPLPTSPPPPPIRPPLPPCSFACSDFSTEAEADAHCAASPDPDMCVKHAPEGSGLHFEAVSHVATCADAGMVDPSFGTANYHWSYTECSDAATFFGVPFSTAYSGATAFPANNCKTSGQGVTSVSKLSSQTGTQACNTLSGYDACVCVKELNPNWQACVCSLYPPSPPPSPPPAACLPRTVAVTVVGNKYYFDGVEASAHSIGQKTYSFTGIPEAHKTTWLGESSVHSWQNAAGNSNEASVKVVSATSRYYRWGDVDLTITGSFTDPAYFDCWSHGSMSGTSTFLYNANC